LSVSKAVLGRRLRLLRENPGQAGGVARKMGGGRPSKLPAKYGLPQSLPLGENPRPAEGVGRKWEVFAAASLIDDAPSNV
jgi:hypothetical protein